MKDRIKEIRKSFPEHGKTQASFAEFLVRRLFLRHHRPYRPSFHTYEYDRKRPSGCGSVQLHAHIILHPRRKPLLRYSSRQSAWKTLRGMACDSGT